MTSPLTDIASDTDETPKLTPEEGAAIDEELAKWEYEFRSHGLPEEPEAPSDEIEVYLEDVRVLRIQEKMWREFPILLKYGAMFATSTTDGPYTGQLPTGEHGTTPHAVVQFIISSTHPRPLQRQHNVPHISAATAFRQAWEESEKERKHYVTGESMDPAEKVFRMLAMKHARDLQNFEDII